MEISYVKSCQIPINMRIKINSVDVGKAMRAPPSSLEMLRQPLLEFSPWADSKKAADLLVQCQVFDGRFPFSLQVETAFKEMRERWDWYEWLELPVLVSDLPRNATLVFTVWDSKIPGEMFCIGTTSVRLFDANGEMNTGMKNLRLVEDPNREDTPEIKKIVHQLNELDLKQSKYQQGQTEQVAWMDGIVFGQIGKLTDNLKNESKSPYLNIQFPTFKYGSDNLSVLYYEQGYVSYYTYPRNPRHCRLYDPSAGMENIVEKKHLALARSLRAGLDDRDIRPNAAIKKKLSEIMEYPPTTVLTGSELDLFWKHRHYLSEHTAALTKFVKCINWDNPDQKKVAKHMLKEWAVLDAETALELLGPSFTVPEVRQYAVKRLGESSDDDLMLYLLQLVQALKYEPFTPDTFTFNEAHYSDDFDMVVQQQQKASATAGAVKTADEGSTRKQSTGSKETLSKADTTSQASVGSSNTTAATVSVASSNTTAATADAASVGSAAALASTAAAEAVGANTSSTEGSGSLLDLLIQRASSNLVLATSLYWFLKVECESSSDQQQQQQRSSHNNGSSDSKSSICQYALDSLLSTLRSGDKSSRYTAHCLSRQTKLVETLVAKVQEMRGKSTRDQKVRFLKNSLADPELEVAHFPQPLPLLLDPTVMVTGVDLDSVRVFKSALEPCKLSFITVAGEGSADGSEPAAPLYHTIFKVGDDLRQDQLILQLITLLERLLLRENLDLKLTPYRVLATAPKHGFVQFIDAAVIAEILREDGSILNFLRKKQADPDAPLGISPQVLDNYIRSCAGYCIITYILGVGDRHHDNLMLTSDGCFFHIDFGYILGRDPKPMPPLIKLSRDITDGMGGQGSEHYQQFRQLCRTTFLSLRRHANLVLNLFSLMVGASIPDIALEPEKAVKKVQDRLHLDLTDEQASSKILSVLHDSANAVMEAVAENLHRFTQYIRN
uniref:Phosphatidylinositol 3-kinase catalytic subunit type 3 n=1 Tax=Hirondellea gigas TaxID=1518452 RepID=A0A6A7FT86_9CRUS